jgi:carbon storage regulator
MLVLTRRVGEEIVIEGDIILTVVSVNGGTIRLGISAPPSVRVDRREVHQRRAEFAAGTKHLHQGVDSPVSRGAVSDAIPANL